MTALDTAPTNGVDTVEQESQDHPLAFPMDRDNLPTVINSDASLMMDPRVFEHMQRVCKVYAQSNVVPQQFQGNLANCMIAYELAYRMQVNVFMLMQSMYVVSGKPGLEAKLAIALVNERGPFRGPIQFTITRDKAGKAIACTAYAIHKATGERCETTVDWSVVEKEGWNKKSGSKWMTMPEQMFKYRSASWLARTYCPEVLMGMHTTDELDDTYGNTRYVDSTATPVNSGGRGAAGLTEKLMSREQPDVIDQDDYDGQIETEQDTADTQPEATAESTDDASGDDARARYQPLIDLLAGKCDCTNDKAEKRLKGYASKVLAVDSLDKLTDKQITDTKAQIANGSLVVN